MTALRVLVVGGGIGGLTVARALERVGADVEVVEQAPRWQPLGAGIVLSANAVAVLDALGLGEAARRAGRQVPWADICDAKGRPMQHLDMAALAAEAGPALTFHRAELHELLLAGAAGARVRLGVTVTALEDTGAEVRATFTDGASGAYHLVVGADGLHSRVRALCFAEAGAKERYAGYTCWRFVTDNVARFEGVVEQWGAGRRAGVVSLAHERVYVFLTENSPAGGVDPAEGRNAHVAAKFAAFDGPARPLLDRLATDDGVALLRHDIAELDRQVWRKGRLALLGDAAHATTPNLGQGAGMAIEDALALGLALEGRSPEDVPSALTAWEAARAPRVAAVVNNSRRLGALGQFSHPVAAGVANLLMKLTPSSVGRRSMLSLVQPGLELAKRARAAAP